MDAWIWGHEADHVLASSHRQPYALAREEAASRRTKEGSTPSSRSVSAAMLRLSHYREDGGHSQRMAVLPGIEMGLVWDAHPSGDRRANRDSNNNSVHDCTYPCEI